MGQFTICNHPLLQHKISMIRNKDTGPKEFRELVEEIAMFICYEATRNMTISSVIVETPVGPAECKQTDKKIGIVPILRAGLGMVEGMLQLVPTAKVGHIGIFREPETLQPVEYYNKLPVDSQDREIFVLDPMLATGNTASVAIQCLKDKGVKNIKFLCIVSCPVGVKKLQTDHPDVDIYTGAHDPELNSHGYIVPGLGDAGDRLFGTK